MGCEAVRVINKEGLGNVVMMHRDTSIAQKQIFV